MLAFRVLACGLSFALMSCGSTADLRGYVSHDPAGKLDAIVACDAEPADDAMLRFLVTQLNCDDSAVRLAAISMLERKTGQTLGYRAENPPDARQRAVDVWVNALKSGSIQPMCRARSELGSAPSRPSDGSIVDAPREASHG